MKIPFRQLRFITIHQSRILLQNREERPGRQPLQIQQPCRNQAHLRNQAHPQIQAHLRMRELQIIQDLLPHKEQGAKDGEKEHKAREQRLVRQLEEQVEMLSVMKKIKKMEAYKRNSVLKVQKKRLSQK